jgi:hypothetical protein
MDMPQAPFSAEDRFRGIPDTLHNLLTCTFTIYR